MNDEQYDQGVHENQADDLGLVISQMRLNKKISSRVQRKFDQFVTKFQLSIRKWAPEQNAIIVQLRFN